MHLGLHSPPPSTTPILMYLDLKNAHLQWSIPLTYGGGTCSSMPRNIILSWQNVCLNGSHHLWCLPHTNMVSEVQYPALVCGLHIRHRTIITNVGKSWIIHIRVAIITIIPCHSKVMCRSNVHPWSTTFSILPTWGP